MMNFYLTLPSNASSQIYSENNPGHYKVKLPRNIFLPENDWEVALASISFPDMVLSLPSTASSRIYPDNTPGKFKVKLEIYLLESEWEVALSSISFPSTSDTVIQ